MKQIKPLKLKLKIIEPEIIFCPNQELFEKQMKRYKGMKENFYTLNSDAVTTIMTADGLRIVIGIKDFNNIYEAKALIVHELSHAVTEIMSYYGFICDEFRSYTLQSLYIDVMPYYDSYLKSKQNET